MTSKYSDNLKIVAKRWPSLARSLEAATPSEMLALEMSRRGTPTLRSRHSPSRWIHSRYDPIREAKTIASAIPPAEYLIFLGLGLGYHIEEALAKKRDCAGDYRRGRHRAIASDAIISRYAFSID